MQEPSNISIVFLVVWISCVISCPIETTIIVPDRENIFSSSSYRFHFPKNFPHEGHKILSGIPINSYNFITFLTGKLLHHPFNHIIRSAIKLLEIVPEVSHNVSAFENSF